MESPSVQKDIVESDNIYLKIWEIEQNHTNTRWTVSTFFFSISFAILGLSFQIENPIVPRIVPQLLAVIIYWFAFLVFRQFNTFTHFLRKYLRDMEIANKTSIKLQSAAKAFMNEHKGISATNLLFIFGIIYTIAGLVLGFTYH